VIDLPRFSALAGRPYHRKVPEVTPAFWTTKVLTTGMGEATSDYLVHQLAPIIAVAFGAAGLGVALVLQFSVRRYDPWIYWLAVAMVAIFGTMAADFLHVELGIPVRGVHRLLFRGARGGLRRLVLGREDAVHPHHRQPAPRGLLLAQRDDHVRAHCTSDTSCPGSSSPS
jgi:hypothetical protein